MKILPNQTKRPKQANEKTQFILYNKSTVRRIKTAMALPMIVKLLEGTCLENNSGLTLSSVKNLKNIIFRLSGR